MSHSQIKVQLSLPQDKVSLRERFKGYLQMMKVDRPFGIFLLVWPALWSLWIAGEGNPNWYVTLVFILGILLVRSAGCAVNEYADRRVANRAIQSCRRPVAMGIVKPREAVVLLAILSAAVMSLLFTLNLNTVLMSLIALALAFVYTWSRRFTHFSQVVSAAIFAWIVPLSFTAVDSGLSLVSWLLYLTAFLWVLIYDLEHAMSQRHTDMINGTKTLAILLEERSVYLLAAMQVLLMVSLLTLGVMTARGWFYFVGISLSVLFMLRQQQLIHRDQIAGAYAAYLNNNCFAMMVFLIILVDYAIANA